MENKKDYNALMEQINLLKNHSERTEEYLAAIQLLMVDDNNGRVKSSEIATNLNSLNSSVSNLNREIELIVNKIANQK